MSFTAPVWIFTVFSNQVLEKWPKKEFSTYIAIWTSTTSVSRNRKLEIQLRVKTDSLYLTTPKHSGGEDKLAVQVQTPKHSGGADITGSAGADSKTQWRCRYHRQCRCRKPGSAESPARAENTVQSAPFREILKRDQARTASGPGRLTQRVRTPQE